MNSAPAKPVRKADSKTTSITTAIYSTPTSSAPLSSTAKPPPPSKKDTPLPLLSSSSTTSSSSSSSSSTTDEKASTIHNSSKTTAPLPPKRSSAVQGNSSQNQSRNLPNAVNVLSPTKTREVQASSSVNSNSADKNELELVQLNQIEICNSSNAEVALNKPRYERIFDPTNKIFHKFRFSPMWFWFAILFHCAQFAILLTIAYKMISPLGIFVCTALAFVIIILLLYAKFKVILNKESGIADLNRRKIFEPEDEKDEISDQAIYALALAAFLEGVLFAVYACLTSGYDHKLDRDGYYTRNLLLQTLRFASINLLAFHRIIRPANRADPMRTMFELEVLGVCWDALDGSTLWELVSSGQEMSSQMDTLIKILMTFWYVSVGSRISCMFCTSLPPESRVYQYILSLPLSLSPQPTVDRTMQGLILRSLITIIMSFSEFCAAILRLVLWSRGQLNEMQQEMCFKNILFLSNIQNAINFKINASLRNWNSPEIAFGINMPSRVTQIEIFRWLFAVFYVTQGALMSSILIQVTGARFKWMANVGFDLFLVALFLIYCKKVHIQSSDLPPQFFLKPAKGFHAFPWSFTGFLTAVMFFNLFIARVPLIYYSFDNLHEATSGYNYSDALIVVNLSIITFILGASFLSVSYMMFRKEFTACPGNYNAIHDPTISMVTSQAQVEGALDILSCTSLMQLAYADLSSSMQGFIALFMILELINAFQSFAFQVVLSGGHKDTPMDLVKLKSKLRFFRFFIDFGAFILRIVLWRQYNVISSVFLIKNLYNLLHAFSQIERSHGIEKYPPGTLFCEAVSPTEWYGMTLDEWRVATRSTLAAQAQSGRRV